MIPKVKYYGPQIPSTYAVNMTAAASGSNGLTVADDADINPGSGPFFIHLDIVPSGYVGSSGARHNSINNSAGTSVNIPIVFFALSGGNVTPNLFINTVGYPATTSVSSAVFLSANKWTIVVTPQSASSGGSVVYYRNGIQFGSAVTIPAGTPHTFTGSNLIIEGTSTSREPGNTISCIVGNFAPTAAEVRDLCTNGIPASWKWGSQAATTSWTWSNFGGGAGYETFTTSGSDITSAINTSGLGIASAAYSFTASKKYQIKLNITVNSGTVEIKANPTTDLSSGGQQIAVITSANDGELTITFTSSTSASAYTRLGFYSPSSSNFSVTGFEIKRAGATMALFPDTIPTSSATTWSDTSGNTGGGTLPAAGATKVTIRK